MTDLARRIERQLHVGISAANLVSAFAVFAFLELALPDRALGETTFAGEIVIAVGFVVLATAIGCVIGHRLGRPVRRWLFEEREPTAFERRRTMRQPAECAALTLALWLIGAIVAAIGAALLFGTERHDAIRIFDTVGLGGLMTAALVYLMVEKIMRPVFALALAGAPPARPTTLGIRPRLVLAWALGSGVPLLGVVVSTVTVDTDSWKAALTTLGAAGLVAGVTLTFLVARAVAGPLEELRTGLERVERGDFDVAVTVDDGGEVGQLQAGFNRMVEGLGERQRLRELFGRQVGEQVAQMAIEQGASLDGEQFEASVLFVDLANSTGLAEDRPPGEALAVFNRLFSTVVRIVNEEGGYVSRFEGDGALCVFGAPAPLADHPSCALRAGRRLAADLSRAGLSAGVGVSSGIVVAGNVGTAERYEYTVIGGPVHEASRLTDEAKKHPCHVLASEAAVARADIEALQWIDGGETVLRGRAAPTRIYAPVPVESLTR